MNRSVRPVALALGVFGALALLAALLVGLQMIARRLSAQRSDHEIMRALGASRPALLFDAILAPILATLAGMILALLIATALSSLTLLGPVRPLLHEGTNFNASILLGAAGVLFVILAAASAALAMRRAPGRSSLQYPRPVSRDADWPPERDCPRRRRPESASPSNQARGSGQSRCGPCSSGLRSPSRCSRAR